MIINMKDIFKMIGILIVTFCAVFVCSLFLNYQQDLYTVESQITAAPAKAMYDAQLMTGKVVCCLSGGCLLLTTCVLLCFYIGHYIDIHNKELGILKAMGYSRIKIAKSFWAFGLNVFLGTALGYFFAHIFMPKFYEVQNNKHYLPDMDIQFHFSLCFFLVILPSLFFALLAIGYSYLKLKMPALGLLRGEKNTKIKTSDKISELPFLQELKRTNIRQKKSLVFFITFAVFCFASMVQMSASMDELSSRTMAIMIICIGLTLACVTLLIATTSVMKANTKTIIMMKVFGYDEKDCTNAVLGSYRPWAYFGFALGTVYQYVLLKIIVSFVFTDILNVPEFHFDVKAMVVTLVLFLVLYEGIMMLYTKKMRKFSVKEIMLE